MRTTTTTHRSPVCPSTLLTQPHNKTNHCRAVPNEIHLQCRRRWTQGTDLFNFVGAVTAIPRPAPDPNPLFVGQGERARRAGMASAERASFKRRLFGSHEPNPSTHPFFRRRVCCRPRLRSTPAARARAHPHFPAASARPCLPAHLHPALPARRTRRPPATPPHSPEECDSSGAARRRNCAGPCRRRPLPRRSPAHRRSPRRTLPPRARRPAASAATAT